MMEDQTHKIISTVPVTNVTEPVTSPTRTKYAWLVLFASFLTEFLNPSISYAAGVFHVALLEKYNDDVTLTAWMGSLYGSMYALGGPVASLVMNMFDCRICVFSSGILCILGFGISAFVTDLRLLFLSYALIAGLGHAFGHVASLVVIGYYFPHDTALASGIAVCGHALGLFAHPPLIQFLIDWYGLNGAFLLAGAISFHSCIFGLLMRPSSNELSRKIKLRSGRTRNEAIWISIFGGSMKDKKVFMTFSFWMFVTSTIFLAMGYAVHILFLPDYMEKVHGTSSHEASLVISFMGIGSVLSRFCVGALANDKRVGPEITYFSIVGITCIISIFLRYFAQGTGGRFTYGLLLGIYTGGVFSLQSPILLQITGIEHFALALGALMLFQGLGAFIGPPVAGMIFKATSNYNFVFLCSSVMFLSSTLCGFLVLSKEKSRDILSKQQQSKETCAELMPLSDSSKIGHTLK